MRITLYNWHVIIICNNNYINTSRATNSINITPLARYNSEGSYIMPGIYTNMANIWKFFLVELVAWDFDDIW